MINNRILFSAIAFGSLALNGCAVKSGASLTNGTSNVSSASAAKPKSQNKYYRFEKPFVFAALRASEKPEYYVIQVKQLERETQLSITQNYSNWLPYLWNGDRKINDREGLIPVTPGMKFSYGKNIRGIPGDFNGFDMGNGKVADTRMFYLCPTNPSSINQCASVDEIEVFGPWGLKTNSIVPPKYTTVSLEQYRGEREQFLAIVAENIEKQRHNKERETKKINEKADAEKQKVKNYLLNETRGKTLVCSADNGSIALLECNLPFHLQYDRFLHLSTILESGWSVATQTTRSKYSDNSGQFVTRYVFQKN